MKPTHLRKFLVTAAPLLAGLLILQACGPRPALRPQPEVAGPATVDAARQAEQAGEYVLAAREYERLAKLVESPEKQNFQLKAVEALIRAAQVKEARQQLAQINVTGLDPAFQARKLILEAQLASLEGQPEQTLLTLARVEKTRNLNPTLMAEIYRVRAQAELTLERPWNALGSLVAREKYIVAPQEVAQNQRQIWHILETQNRGVLEHRRSAARDPALIDWLDLALMVGEKSRSPKQLALAIEEWKKSRPLHGISPEFLLSLAGPAPSIGRIDRIALLLPLTSDYARAAQAVRDGFMAMNNANVNPDKPQVRVYDVGADPAQATGFYAQAIQDGAQLVIGPLGLEAVDQLVKHGKLDVPTILLSHTTQELSTSVNHIFQFGLPPEQEAAQSAERAYLDGYRRAAVLFPDTAWGQRMATAFTATWQRLGGIMLTSQAYLPDQGDYSDPIKKLLNITQSEARKDALETTLKIKLKFEPRPREDIDFIFLAADARHARLIKPQFNFNYALRLPVYATSHVFTGQGNQMADIDLDGIMFGDMPWMLVGDGRIQSLRQTLQRDWPYAHTQFDRLYALGIDAYAIVPQLNRISMEDSAHFSGVTSGLSLGRDGRLRRQLLWAQFRKGTPQLLDTFFKHKGQFEIDDGQQSTEPPKTGS